MKRSDFALQLLKKRKTTYEFSDRNVKVYDLMKILEAGRFAPSILNTQPWHFIIIKNPATIDKIMRLSIYGVFHTNPKLMIAIILTSDSYDLSVPVGFKMGTPGLHESFQCIGIAAFSMTLESGYLKIGSCLLTPKEGNEINKLLKLRINDLVPIIVGVGYEKKGAFQKQKERKELKSIISYETYFGKKNHD